MELDCGTVLVRVGPPAGSLSGEQPSGFLPGGRGVPAGFDHLRTEIGDCKPVLPKLDPRIESRTPASASYRAVTRDLAGQLAGLSVPAEPPHHLRRLRRPSKATRASSTHGRPTTRTCQHLGASSNVSHEIVSTARPDCGDPRARRRNGTSSLELIRVLSRAPGRDSRGRRGGSVVSILEGGYGRPDGAWRVRRQRVGWLRRRWRTWRRSTRVLVRRNRRRVCCATNRRARRTGPVVEVTTGQAHPRGPYAGAFPPIPAPPPKPRDQSTRSRRPTAASTWSAPKTEVSRSSRARIASKASAG